MIKFPKSPRQQNRVLLDMARGTSPRPASPSQEKKKISSHLSESQSMTTQTFAREYRYCVMKITDTKAALTQTEQEILDLLIDKVRRSRTHNGKAPLQGVFVENDWPEHDGIWTAIEQRITGKPPEPLV